MGWVDLTMRDGAAREAGRPTVWKRRLGLGVPAAALSAICFACFLFPFVHDLPAPTGGSVLDANQAALSPGHVLGTDANGNDNWSRLLHGGRASIAIAIGVNLLGLVLGGLIGATAGHVGGVFDKVVARALDAMIAFPPLVLVLAVAEALGPSTASAIWALSFFSVPAFARIARSATLGLESQLFMVAARLSGTGIIGILSRHVVPNILPQLMTFALLGVGVAIILEGALSYLGLGVPPPHPSWGNMIYQGQQSLLTRPFLVLLPAGALFFTVLSFNLLGEALRARWGMR